MMQFPQKPARAPADAVIGIPDVTRWPTKAEQKNFDITGSYNPSEQEFAEFTNGGPA